MKERSTDGTKPEENHNFPNANEFFKMGIKVSIFGVAGYTGAQLLSILTNHSDIYIDAVFGNKTVGMSLPEIFQKNTNIPLSLIHI